MEQNTTEWLNWRRQGLGGSDAPIVMGDSPYCTPLELWKQKRGESEGPAYNEAMRRGHELEPQARAAYELEHELEMPPKLVQHGEFPWLRCSLDGFNEAHGIVLEIKCPGAEDHKYAMSGVVPRKYEAQLQHQLMVTGARTAHYWSYDGKHGALVVVEADKAYQAGLFLALQEFWRMVESGQSPPLTERDFFEAPSGSELWTLCADLKSAKADLDRAKEQFDHAKAELVRLMPHNRVTALGVKVTRSTVRGRIDYAKVKELSDVDLEKYRKPDTEQVRVTFGKADK